MADVSTRLLDLTYPDHQVLLHLALDVDWILKQHSLVPGRTSLRKCYLQILNECGLASWSGKIRIAKLFDRFTTSYSCTLLDSLQIKLNSRKFSSWLSNLLKAPKGALPPLKQLLLLRLLGYTPESFFEKCKSAEHFLPASITHLSGMTSSERIRSTKPRPKPSNDKIRSTYRKQLLLIRKQHPEVTRSQIRLKLFSKGYCWLNEYDKDWLFSHLPPPQKWAGRARKVDWNSLDRKFAEKTRQTALKLRNDSSCLKRVTSNCIAKSIDKLGSTIRHTQLKQLPMTKMALAEVVESRFDYALRRLSLAENYFRQEGVAPSKSMLLRRAGICSDLRKMPELKKILEAVWLALQGIPAVKAA